MKLTMIAIALSAGLLLTGCGKGGNTNSTTTTTNTSNTTKTTTATPSPQASPTASATPAKSMSTEDTVSTPEAAAQGLFNAFGRHDRDAAAKFASDAAVTKLFKESTGTQGMQFQGCNDEEGELNCAYSYEGGALIMNIKGSASTGYKVASVEFIAD